MDKIRRLRVAVGHIKLWPEAYEMNTHDTNVCKAVAETMENVLAVVEAAKPVAENTTPSNWCNLKRAVLVLEEQTHE